MRRALQGWEQLKKNLDTSIVVPNQNLFKVANETTTFEQSFSLSNDVLKRGVQSVTDLMVRPGLINLDFADVETVMSSMGKAMMGSGEAEGENRALAATELALNNPLIDDYSLKGARGLLVNITGGEDIKLFEVDQAVNKIRAEVDPEAELIFGAIKDDNLEGKMRVSVVATALDGEVLEPKSVVNMVHRIHNRNSGYSDNLTKKNNVPEMPNFDSIQGATALKLDNQVEENKVEENKNDLILGKQDEIKDESIKNDDPMFSGLSLDNASYFENNSNQLQDGISVFDEKSEDNATETNNNDDPDPQLFSDEDSFNNSSESNDQEISKNEDEEDFEIPAFLRNQKF
jgi:cell division protein FtsZ